MQDKNILDVFQKSFLPWCEEILLHLESFLNAKEKIEFLKDFYNLFEQVKTISFALNFKKTAPFVIFKDKKCLLNPFIWPLLNSPYFNESVIYGVILRAFWAKEKRIPLSLWRQFEQHFIGIGQGIESIVDEALRQIDSLRELYEALGEDKINEILKIGQPIFIQKKFLFQYQINNDWIPVLSLPAYFLPFKSFAKLLFPPKIVYEILTIVKKQDISKDNSLIRDLNNLCKRFNALHTQINTYIAHLPEKIEKDVLKKIQLYFSQLYELATQIAQVRYKKIEKKISEILQLNLLGKKEWTSFFNHLLNEIHNIVVEYRFKVKDKDLGNPAILKGIVVDIEGNILNQDFNQALPEAKVIDLSKTSNRNFYKLLADLLFLSAQERSFYELNAVLFDIECYLYLKLGEHTANIYIYSNLPETGGELRGEWLDPAGFGGEKRIELITRVLQKWGIAVNNPASYVLLFHYNKNFGANNIREILWQGFKSARLLLSLKNFDTYIEARHPYADIILNEWEKYVYQQGVGIPQVLMYHVERRDRIPIFVQIRRYLEDIVKILNQHLASLNLPLLMPQNYTFGRLDIEENYILPINIKLNNGEFVIENNKVVFNKVYKRINSVKYLATLLKRKSLSNYYTKAAEIFKNLIQGKILNSIFIGNIETKEVHKLLLSLNEGQFALYGLKDNDKFEISWVSHGICLYSIEELNNIWVNLDSFYKLIEKYHLFLHSPLPLKESKSSVEDISFILKDIPGGYSDGLISSVGVATGFLVKNTPFQSVTAFKGHKIFSDTFIVPQAVEKARVAKGVFTTKDSLLSHAHIRAREEGIANVITYQAEWKETESPYLVLHYRDWISELWNGFQISYLDHEGEEKQVIVKEGDIIRIVALGKVGRVIAVGADPDPSRDIRAKIRQIFLLLTELDHNKYFSILKEIESAPEETQPLLLKFLLQELLLTGTVMQEDLKIDCLKYFYTSLSPSLKEFFLSYLKKIHFIYFKELENLFNKVEKRLIVSSHVTEVLTLVREFLQKCKAFNELEQILISKSIPQFDIVQLKERLIRLYHEKLAIFQKEITQKLDVYLKKLPFLPVFDLGKIMRLLKQAEFLGLNLNQPLYLYAQAIIHQRLNESIAQIYSGIERLVVDLKHVGSYLHSLVGYKAAEIGEILNEPKLNTLTPTGFVITTSGVRAIIHANTHLLPEIEKILKSQTSKEQKFKKIENILLAKGELPSLLKKQIATHYQKLGEGYVAIRSSSLLEDTLESSQAGRFLTFLYIKGLPEIYKRIFSSLAYYWAEVGRIDDYYPILIQQFLESEAALVGNSINLGHQDWQEMVINASLGLGEGLVSGEVPADTYIFDTRNFRLKDSLILEKKEKVVINTLTGQGTIKKVVPTDVATAPVLSPKEGEEAINKMIQLEAYYGYPIDMEAVKVNGKIAVVQVRPITSVCRSVYQITGYGFHTPSPTKIKGIIKKLADRTKAKPDRNASLTSPARLLFTASIIPAEVIAQLFDRYIDKLYATRSALIERKTVEHELVIKIVQMGGMDYDEAREAVLELIKSIPDRTAVKTHLETLLAPELRDNILDFLFERRLISYAKKQSLRQEWSIFKTKETILNTVKKFIYNFPQNENLKKDLNDLIQSWQWRTHAYGDRYIDSYIKWQRSYELEIAAIYQDKLLDLYREQVTPEELHQLIRYLFPRLYANVPHLKDISRPTIVLIGATSGAGKSSLARAIAKRLRIPIYFSTDVLRQVLRRFIPKEIWPDLHRSSFQGDPIELGFYKHAITTSVGIKAAISRLIKENTSAIIEGVPLIPGLLPEEFFRDANIVQMVISVPDENIHLKRFDIRGIEAGKRQAERYKKHFFAIRRCQETILKAAEKANIKIVVNEKDLISAQDEVCLWTSSAYADRFREFSDSLREEALKHIIPLLQLTPSLPEIPRFKAIDIKKELWERMQKKPIFASVLEQVSLEKIVQTVFKYKDLFWQERKARLPLHDIQFHLVNRLAKCKGYYYDSARAAFAELFQVGLSDRSLPPPPKNLASSLKQLLTDEIKSRLQTLLFDDRVYHLNLDEIDNYELGQYIEKYVPKERVAIYYQAIERWEEELDKLAERYQNQWQKYKMAKENLVRHLGTDKVYIPYKNKIPRSQWIGTLRYAFPALIPNVPHLKDLQKPTIILLSSPTGTGKSFLARAIAERAGIPIYFSTNYLREAIRQVVPKEFWGAVHRSSFELPPILDEKFQIELETCKHDKRKWNDFLRKWQPIVLKNYYAHALETLPGILGAIDRLLKENTSAVIEGVSIVPGFIPNKYFEEANLVLIVVTLSQQIIHYKRIQARCAKEIKRSRFERYRAHFTQIRIIHDHLQALASRNKLFVIDSSNLQMAIFQAIRAVESATSDRYFPIFDPLREEVYDALSKAKSDQCLY